MAWVLCHCKPFRKVECHIVVGAFETRQLTVSVLTSTYVQLDETEEATRLAAEAADHSASTLHASEEAVKSQEADIMAAKGANDEDGVKQREGRLFDLRRDLSGARRHAHRDEERTKEAAARLQDLRAAAAQVRSNRRSHVHPKCACAPSARCCSACVQMQCSFCILLYTQDAL